jgi:Aromatic-ring-opening dioxygenase LigAB, LigA subunit
MTDYWVSKLFFDLQQDPKLAAEYRADMAAVIGRYEIKPELRKALLEDDIGTIAPLVNAYLLRFYFAIRGMPEAEFIARLHALQAKNETKSTNEPKSKNEPKREGTHG